MKQVEKLQLNLKPDVIGVFWITNEKLLSRPLPFHSLDYFLDGLLSRHYERMTQDSKISVPDTKNFFVSESFGNPFFVAYMLADTDKTDNDLEELMNLVLKLKKSKRNSIMLIDSSKQKHQERMEKRFPNFKFKTIDLEA
ncbi:MAG: hypothetical protein KAQ98_09640 [Bacteriovoracaceae bacterium]|nr:hypothetical protein [Bacteriovoracaceae bacterium]